MTEQSSYVEQNRAELERLKALVERLTEHDYQRSVGHGWTVGSTLAHMAFWDRRTLANLEKWEREGVQIVPTEPDPINDGMLPEWLATPGAAAAREAIAAAEAVDLKVEQLDSALVSQVMAQRPRTIVRAMHRRGHLDEIERALA